MMPASISSRPNNEAGNTVHLPRNRDVGLFSLGAIRNVLDLAVSHDQRTQCKSSMKAK